MNPLKMMKIFGDQSGFSLTEIMIGGGILAGVALAGAQMFKNQTTAQNKVDSEQKLTLFHQGLTKTLNNAANCNATMKQAGLAGGSSIPGNRALTSINLCDNSSGKCIETDAGNIADDVQVGNAVARVGQNIEANSDLWRITGMNIPTAKNTSGAVILRVTYARAARLGGKTITKDIVLNTRFTGGVFKECVNSQDSLVNNLQKDLCQTLNHDDINSTGFESGNLATWNEATQTCDIGVDKECPQGMAVNGVDSLGIVKCKNIAPAANTLQNTTISPACPTKPTMRYDSVSGTFIMGCN